MTNLPVNGRRLWADVMSLAEITEPERPYTRSAFTPRFLEGRDFLRDRFEAAGLNTRIDVAGNLIGRRPGRNPGTGTILIGSHSDTVPNGGRFDGAAGVIAALEVARSLHERAETLEHDLEVVDYLAEEANPYGVSCVGSRGVAGRLSSDMLNYAEPGGEIVAEALRRMGGDPGRISEAVRKDILGYVELHIEQGRVLESEGIDIGIVSGVVGIMRLEIVVEGRADHAGTTPMSLRSDALYGAAEIIRAIRRKGADLAGAGLGYFAATVGVLDNAPNAANVISASTRLIVDARAEKRSTMEYFAHWTKDTLHSIAIDAGTRLSRLAVLSDSREAIADAWLMKAVSEAADSLGLTWRKMASGAGHDAAHISHIAPMAMIFTPCREGRSHCADEWVEPEQLAAGAAAMFETVKRIDRAHAKPSTAE
jgi:beta-ureidopropionase / N-carbamoyl-L-amino-acid hydrolase